MGRFVSFQVVYGPGGTARREHPSRLLESPAVLRSPSSLSGRRANQLLRRKANIVQTGSGTLSSVCVCGEVCLRKSTSGVTAWNHEHGNKAAGKSNEERAGSTARPRPGDRIIPWLQAAAEQGEKALSSERRHGRRRTSQCQASHSCKPLSFSLYYSSPSSVLLCVHYYCTHAPRVPANWSADQPLRVRPGRGLGEGGVSSHASSPL